MSLFTKILSLKLIVDLWGSWYASFIKTCIMSILLVANQIFTKMLWIFEILWPVLIFYCLSYFLSWFNILRRAIFRFQKVKLINKDITTFIWESQIPNCDFRKKWIRGFLQTRLFLLFIRSMRKTRWKTQEKGFGTNVGSKPHWHYRESLISAFE